ncbi:MAG: 30S ribosomal protein S4 [Candidatus Terrybacteria bacterium RIFCSPLOWO2_01_FULL_44_24]|uniref:Small ribosomal subunit protein uS4 n=1 Tax=Candidatus Terrybacteria bacterium RIFCSPHIGHO2_01_FULL_43_35 TaxID=1802361 RepID=A0A1G2PFI6_9BACT|nr:MAG: 30S ribosomal protein S4 [Candidatus Terrybacteria bacterium RIFCSPHIGHO2_01_FULL_43_35]OHA49946.1 MAG: 30S ribosomal protein S4 [Candidatus Terrybacteria bacterium RIFCSPHIGHO2_02_FULL_43_14]OHA51732.1 MAG: 30S ribosomal protein S4 [Candidatus Terrybacteria bacterium RIFCSPLOWO2_01_FULL_44_24]
MIGAKCKICRRAGQKLFLKGDRCFSPKCAIVRRPYPPGVHGQKSRPSRSEFGLQLAEKRKLEASYHIDERDLKRIVKEGSSTRPQNLDIADMIVNRLESRLDNVIYRLGFVVSRSVARQLVSHGHFYINDRRMDIPSYLLRIGDKVSIRPASKDKSPFKNMASHLEKYTPPSWIELDKQELNGKVIGVPNRSEIGLPVDLSMIVAYYSR